MASKKFPAEVFITHDANADAGCENDLFAWTEEGDGVEGDGPTEIGVYRLVGVVRATKKLVVEKKS